MTKADKVVVKVLLKGACTGYQIFMHHTLSCECVIGELWCKTILSKALCVVFSGAFWVLLNFARHSFCLP